MQIIQQIREKGTAIIIAVIAISLIGFILMDANLGSNRMNSGGNGDIGSINGQPVSNSEFAAKVKQMEEQYGGRVSGSQLYQIRQTAWDQLTAEKIFTAEFEKLGISYSPQELTATMFSDDAPQTLKQAFSDPATGKYDIAKAQQWWQTAKKSKGEQRDAIVSQVIEPMKLQSLFTKYNGLIAAGGYYPNWLREKENNERNTFATLSLVNIPYTVIADSTVKVSDEDINKYVSARKTLYKQEGGRLISYLTFSTNPSSSDTQSVNTTILNLRESFAADTNMKVFMARNMSTRKFDEAYVPKSKITGAQKDSILNLGANRVYGPYLDGKEFVLARMMGTKILPDSIKCRHILIGTVNRETGEATMDTALAHRKIDSIAALVASGVSFDSLEAQNSTDQAAHKDKGVMTFDVATVQNKQNFAPEFGEFLLNEKGETRKTVKTNFGWHYIEILEKKNPTPCYKIAYLSREILPSEETINKATAKANKLSGEVRDIKTLEGYIKKNGMESIRVDHPLPVKENDYQLGALQDARQIVKWAFEAKEGAISEPFNIGDQFVVAALRKIQPAGLPDAATARPQVENQIRNMKKAEQIGAKVKSASSLEAVASVYNNPVQPAGSDSSITFNAQLINGMAEPKVIGAVFNKANQTKVSEPIAGNTGVFYIKVNSYGTKPDQSAGSADRARSIGQQLSSGFFESLKKMSDIKDERSTIY
jgi:peptidyl-prolyl cis-trans isomerase D